MLDMVVSAAQQPVVPWVVLSVVAFAVVVEAFRVGREAFWGDMFDDDLA